MLFESCLKLHQFYLEATHVINSLEVFGKQYRKGGHKEHYFERLGFYKRMLNTSRMSRRMHFPKILKDMKDLKNNFSVLEFNKSELRVCSSLGDVGDPHMNKGIIY